MNDIVNMDFDQMMKFSKQLMVSTFNLQAGLGVVSEQVKGLVTTVSTIQTTQVKNTEQLNRLEITGMEIKVIQEAQSQKLEQQGQKIDQIEDAVARINDETYNTVRTISNANKTSLALVAAIKRFGFNYFQGMGFAWPYYRGQELCIGFNLDLMLMIIKATYGDHATGNGKGKPTKANSWGEKKTIAGTFITLGFKACNADDMEWIGQALRFVPGAYYGKTPKPSKNGAVKLHGTTNHACWFWIQAQHLADILKANEDINKTVIPDKDGNKKTYNLPEYQCFLGDREVYDLENIIENVQHKAKSGAQIVNLARFGRCCEGERTDIINKAFFDALMILNPKHANTRAIHSLLAENRVPPSHTFSNKMILKPVAAEDAMDTDEVDLGLPIVAPEDSEKKTKTRSSRKRKSEESTTEEKQPSSPAPAPKRPKVATTKSTTAASADQLMPVTLPLSRTTRASSSSSSSK